MHNRIESYVLNEYLRFERKLYSIFGINLGRSIQLKSLMYFLFFLALEFVLSVLPIFGNLISGMPVIMWVLFPVLLAYLLSDVGTENRSPLSYFASFLRYHTAQLRRESYYQGKVIPSVKPLKFERAMKIGRKAKEEQD